MTSPQTSRSIRVGLGRSNVVMVVAMVAFLSIMTIVPVVGSLKRPGTPLGFFIGGMFGVVLIYFLAKLGPFLRPRAYEFDEDGLTFWHGQENVSIPWTDIIAIGVGYEARPEDRPSLKVPGSVEEAVTDRVKDVLTDKATEALQVSGKRRIGLEVYPAAPELFAKYPRIKPFVKRLRPVEPSLPADLWRLPLPPVMTIARQVGQGAQTFVPARWLGWYGRPWSA